jgi:hypothetical protein
MPSHQTALVQELKQKITDEDLTKNATQCSINQQIFPLTPERILSELPEPPLRAPSVAIMYTSEKAFVGTDRFTVHRVSHSGNLRVYEYIVTVEQLHSTEVGASKP